MKLANKDTRMIFAKYIRHKNVPLYGTLPDFQIVETRQWYPAQMV